MLTPESPSPCTSATIKSNVRELEGALIRLAAYAYSNDQLDLVKTFTVFPDKYLVRMAVKGSSTPIKRPSSAHQAPDHPIPCAASQKYRRNLLA